jgi:pyruvate formate lyase activating enzyme
MPAARVLPFAPRGGILSLPAERFACHQSLSWLSIALRESLHLTGLDTSQPSAPLLQGLTLLVGPSVGGYNVFAVGCYVEALLTGGTSSKAQKTRLKGTVFNIQRFSVHDGPGIRTTIFLKGCGLRCFWCHNPEGVRASPEVQFYPERCIDCGACAAVCPHGAHRSHHGTRIFERDMCQACGRCAETCYAGALELTGKTMTLEQVMSEVLPDRAFYESSGGGITLSGGEPLMQQAFARAVLERCKDEGFHTAIETSANCRWDNFAELLPLVDLVMMDLKHMDAGKHRAATGASNERILANAQRLMHTDRPVLFRTPVVPTVNDTAADISAIAAFVQQLANIRLGSNSGKPSTPPPAFELLEFHRLAADKYRSLGLEYRARELDAPTADEMDTLRRLAASYSLRSRVRSGP